MPEGPASTPPRWPNSNRNRRPISNWNARPISLWNRRPNYVGIRSRTLPLQKSDWPVRARMGLLKGTVLVERLQSLVEAAFGLEKER